MKFGQIANSRHSSYIDHSSRVTLGTVYYKRIAGISSMQGMTREFNEEKVVKNLYGFMGSGAKEYLPHGARANEFLERFKLGGLEEI